MQKSSPNFCKIVLVLLLCIQSLQAQVSLTATSGTVSGSYTTLKGAFDAINAGTHTGDISVTITANTTESATATLNANGAGSANYSSMLIQPGGGGSRTVSGNINGAIVSLNGADNIIINGLNSGGNSLTIENSNTGTSSTALQFINGATSCIISNTSFKGSNASTTTYTHGVLTFSSGTNSNNQILYCNVGPSGSNKPSRCIVSGAGTNNNITINHCNIYDFSGGSGTGINDRHSAIYLYFGTTSAWTITNNSIYQTTSNALASEGIISMIYVRSGEGYNISNNYIGGTEPLCGGSKMTYSGVIKEFYIIELGSGMGNTTLTTINNNTIRNISMSSSSTSGSTNNSVPRFTTIHVRKGKVTINYNTIGSTTENGSISLTQTNSTFSLFYFLVPLAYSNYVVNVTNCNHNTIAGISISATYFDATGVHMESYTGNSLDSFSYNTIGSTTQSNSIEISRLTSSVTRNFYQSIFASAITSGARVVSNNTIQNISRGSSSSTDGMYGIYSFLDSGMISGNKIINMTSGGTGTVCGIQVSYSPDQTVTGNFISRIGCSGNTSTDVIGISNDYSGTNGPIYNNIINLGLKADGSSFTDCPFIGIRHRYSTDIYFNSVYISGTTGSRNSYAYLEYFNSNSRNIRNNIFVNERSNTAGSAKHYAAYFYGTTGLTVDYNDYYVSGTGGVLAYLSGDRTTLGALRTATSQDVNSMNTSPNFVSGGTNISDDYLCKNNLSGVAISGFTTDYNLLTRGLTPMMGALDGYYWRGNTSSDFATASNWIGGTVPPDNAYVIFDPSPVNHCVLDANHIIGNLINNQNNFGLDLNGFELSISGDINFTNNALIYAHNIGSKLRFVGSDTQQIPTGAIYQNQIHDLEIDNPFGLNIYDNDTILGTLTMTQGNLYLNGNTMVLGSSASSTGTLDYTDGRIYGTFSRWFGAVINSGNTGLFPLGYGDYDRFVTVEYGTQPATGGTLTATYNPVSMGTDGLPLYNIAPVGSCAMFDVTETSSEGYWIMDDGNSLSGGIYDITLVGEGFQNINDLCQLSAIKRSGFSPWFESGNHEEPTGTTGRPVLKRTSASGWSNWGFGAGSLNPLPVKFVGIKVICNGMDRIVRWQTIAEEHACTYIIESSMDGKEWNKIGALNGTGDYQNISTYRFNDANASGRFYRVRQIETDGEVSISNIAASNCTVEENIKISAFPNPVNDQLILTGMDQIGMVEIYDSNGKLVLSGEFDSETAIVSTSNLSAGVYHVKTTYSSLRFVKQ